MALVVFPILAYYTGKYHLNDTMTFLWLMAAMPIFVLSAIWGIIQHKRTTLNLEVHETEVVTQRIAARNLERKVIQVQNYENPRSSVIEKRGNQY